MRRFPGVNKPGAARTALGLILGALAAAPSLAEEPCRVEFHPEPGRLRITVDGQPLATYVYRDEAIPRPYFAHVHAPGAVQVTRHHPPIEGKDPTDHATFHPGIWLAFGDLGGADSWRLRARVDHERFVEVARPGDGQGSFVVANRYLSVNGEATICREVCRYTVIARPDRYLLISASEFRTDLPDLAFGDQEEMGLGVRLATPLTVKQGGHLTDSAGREGEGQVRGKTASWCDGHGTIDGRDVGITVLTDPENFRPSWFHARDYGLIVANPFGRKALTGGPASRVVLPRDEAFRLGFAVLLHSGKSFDVAEAYRDYLRVVGRREP